MQTLQILIGADIADPDWSVDQSMQAMHWLPSN